MPTDFDNDDNEPEDFYNGDGDGEEPKDLKDMSEEQIIASLKLHLTPEFVSKIQRLNEFGLFLTMERCNSLIDAVEIGKGLDHYPMRLLGLGCPVDFYRDLEYAPSAKEKNERRKFLTRALVMGTMTVALMSVRRFGVTLPEFKKIAKMKKGDDTLAEVDVHDWIRWWRAWFYTQPKKLRKELKRMFEEREPIDDWLPLESWAERKAQQEEDEEDSKLAQIGLLSGGWAAKDTVEERIKKIEQIIGRWTMNVIDDMNEIELFTFIESTGSAAAKANLALKISGKLGIAEMAGVPQMAEAQRFEAMLAYAYYNSRKFGIEGDAIINSTDPAIRNQIQAWLEWWTKYVKSLDKPTTQKMLLRLVLHDDLGDDIELPPVGEWRKTYDPNVKRDTKDANEMFDKLDINLIRVPGSGFDSGGEFGKFLGL